MRLVRIRPLPPLQILDVRLAWYGQDENDYAGQSCRLLETCMTEFGTQGLELDAALLAWGTDLVWLEGG